MFVKGSVFHDKTKHIDVRYHFFRTKKRIEVKKIGTTDNPVDTLTKLVRNRTFMHLLGLSSVDRRR